MKKTSLKTNRQITRSASCLASMLLINAILLVGCSENAAKYPSAEGKKPPYILKEDCTFSIVEELSKASINSPKVTGMDSASASAGVSLGDKSITVSNCEVTENSHNLPIYEN